MKTADVVVIGGGVMGTSIAYELGRRKAGKVVVLEKSYLGAGSSGKSGAVIRQHYSHRLTASLAQYGLQVFKRFPEIVGGPAVFTHTGMVAVCPAGERVQLEESITMQKALGIKVNQISKDELRSLDPKAVLQDDEIAAFESEAGYCDALQVVASLGASARALGAEISEGVEVTGIQIEGGKVAGVSTSSGAIASRTVVLAAGPWAAPLALAAGVSLPVKPCRTQVALVRRPSEFGASHPIYADFTNQVYCKPLPGELTHAGNIDPREERAEVNPDAYREVADEEFTQEIRAKLCRRYPLFHRAVGRGGYGALYSVTPDWHPIVDRFPGVEGCFCAVGFSGHGFKMAPAVGKLIGEMVLDGAARSFDIQPLRASRFAEGELFGGKTAYKVMG